MKQPRHFLSPHMHKHWRSSSGELLRSQKFLSQSEPSPALFSLFPRKYPERHNHLLTAGFVAGRDLRGQSGRTIGLDSQDDQFGQSGRGQKDNQDKVRIMKIRDLRLGLFLVLFLVSIFPILAKDDFSPEKNSRFDALSSIKVKKETNDSYEVHVLNRRFNWFYHPRSKYPHLA